MKIYVITSCDYLDGYRRVVTATINKPDELLKKLKSDSKMLSGIAKKVIEKGDTQEFKRFESDYGIDVWDAKYPPNYYAEEIELKKVLSYGYTRDVVFSSQQKEETNQDSEAKDEHQTQDKT